MSILRISALIAAAGVGLAACNENERRDGGAGSSRGGERAGGICTPFAAQGAAAGGQATPGMAGPGMAGPGLSGGAAGMEDCLHRWGYALAASPDPADHVAQATVAACATALTRWNQQAMAPMGPGMTAGPAEAPSLVTGEDTNPMAERYRFAQNRALFYVVQARAGKCRPPSMNEASAAGQAERY